MMGHREKLVGGAEWDAFSRWRKITNWRPGEVKRIKQKFHRRVRHQAKRRLKEWYSAATEAILGFSQP